MLQSLYASREDHWTAMRARYANRIIRQRETGGEGSVQASLEFLWPRREARFGSFTRSEVTIFELLRLSLCDVILQCLASPERPTLAGRLGHSRMSDVNRQISQHS